MNDPKIPVADRLYRAMADKVPQLKRGQVWCWMCGHTEKVNSADCLRSGWPNHCGQTMSIDPPEARKGRVRG